MRVLITGGTGLVGRALSASLADGGHEVIVLSRDPGQHGDLPAGVQAARWDGRTAQGWGSLADGADAIVNLAGANIGASPWTRERQRLIRDSRLNAGRAVVQAVELAARKPRVVVQASGINYYGLPGDERVDESAPPGDDFLARLCVEWEAATAPVEALGVRRVITRSALVLSMDDGALPRLVLPFRFLVGGPLGSGRQWYSWIHIADEVGAMRLLIEKEEAAGPFNLAAPNPVTNAEFSRVVGKVLGRPSLFRVPAFALRLILGKMAMVVLEGQRVVPRRLLEMGYSFRFPTLEGALRDLLA